MPSAPSSSDDRARAVEDLCRGCDLIERLTLVPPSASVRGLYFGSIERALSAAGRLEPYKALFPQRFAAVLWHPAAEFLTRLAVGGALLAGPEKVHEGMFAIGRGNAVAFAESLIGRAMLRLLDRDPRRLLRQAIAGRRQSYTFGRWDLTFPAEREAIVTMIEEYAYLDSYMLGAAQGTFDAIGVPVLTQVVMRDRFNGQHVLKW
jgi:uncharacterized protein (TIGR02265 family)